MEPFKNIYNEDSVTILALAINKHMPEFKSKMFISTIMETLENHEMKGRVDLIAYELIEHLPKNYKRAVNILIKTLSPICTKSFEIKNIDQGLNGFMLWPVTRYFELQGTDDIDTSLKGLYEVTKRFTGEFGIRPFIDLYPKEVYEKMTIWRDDKNHHVRRFVSEGMRPNLPWGLKSTYVIKNLKKNIKLITPLRDDKSEYVRKSVANHLNDISRLDDELFLKVISKFVKEKQTKEKKWLITHACRSLFKQGHPKVLELNGYSPKLELKVKSKLSPQSISEGEKIDLSLSIKNLKESDENVIIDYIIYYPKKNGELSPKVFRVKKTPIKGNETLNIEKTIHFKKVTTRVHYKGQHKIDIQINGIIFKGSSFNLK